MSDYQKKKWWVLIGVGIVAITICIDFTIVNTILANIQLDLNATVGELQWVMAGFGLLFCTFLITMGRLADLIGRRLLLYIGVIGFGFASLGAGLSQTPTQLILFRVLQGAFGATVFPCGVAIISDAFPKVEHGKALGMYGSILGIGLAIGPVVGGTIVTFASWRWVFLINIPIIIVSMLICIPTVRESKIATKQPIDWWGFLLITLFVSAFVFAINQSPLYGWTSPYVYVSLIVAFIALIITIRLETKLKYPLLPLHLFANREFSLASIVMVTSISFAWAIIFIVPLFLHTVWDKSPGIVGLLLLPMTAMTAIAPTFAGNALDKWGRKKVVIVMFIFLIFGLAMLLTLGIKYNLGLMLIGFITYGIAWGMGNGIGTPIALSNTETTEHSGLISGAAITVLNIFGVMSLSIGISIFRYLERIKLFNLLKEKNYVLTTEQQHAIGALLSDPERASKYIRNFGGKAHIVLHSFHVAFVHGYRVVIWIFLILSLIGFGISIYLMKGMKKRQIQ